MPAKRKHSELQHQQQLIIAAAAVIFNIKGISQELHRDVAECTSHPSHMPWVPEPEPYARQYGESERCVRQRVELEQRVRDLEHKLWIANGAIERDRVERVKQHDRVCDLEQKQLIADCVNEYKRVKREEELCNFDDETSQQLFAICTSNISDPLTVLCTYPSDVKGINNVDVRGNTNTRMQLLETVDGKWKTRAYNKAKIKLDFSYDDINLYAKGGSMIWQAADTRQVVFLNFEEKQLCDISFCNNRSIVIDLANLLHCETKDGRCIFIPTKDGMILTTSNVHIALNKLFWLFAKLSRETQCQTVFLTLPLVYEETLRDEMIKQIILFLNEYKPNFQVDIIKYSGITDDSAAMEVAFRYNAVLLSRDKFDKEHEGDFELYASECVSTYKIYN